jgi:hypothetical protein
MTSEESKELLTIMREIADSMEHLVRFVNAYATMKLEMPHVPGPAETRTQPSRGNRA